VSGRNSALAVPPAARPRWNEAERLAALREYGILDTPPEREFNDIIEIAALVCEAPIAVVNFVADTRQFFKAEIGLGVRETPLDVSICAHAILQDDLFVVPDTTRDPRFDCNPLVTGEPHLRFYAGALLKSPEGHALGTICVLDHKPRPGLTEKQAYTLTALARQVMTQLEYKRMNERLRQREEEVAASERQLRAILDTMPQMVWSTRPDGHHDYYNKRWYEFTGVPDGSTDGEGWNGMFHPDDQPLAWERWRHSLATGEPYEVEYRLRHHTGAYRWTLGRALPIRNGEGRIERWFGTCTDIDDQKGVQEALRRTDERLHLALNASGTVGSWLWDMASNRIYADARFAEFFGVDARTAQTVGAPVGTFIRAIHPEDRERVEASIAAAVETGGDYECEYRLVRPDGSVRWVNARGRCEHGLDGKPVRFPGVVVDITDRKCTEAELASRTAQIEVLLSTAPVAVWFTDDPQVRRVMRNSHAAALMRVPQETTASFASTDKTLNHARLRYDGAFVTPDRMPLQRAVRGENVREEEYELVFDDGTVLTLLSSSSPLRDAAGEIVGAVAISLDITARKRIEEARELLARELSHRIKNIFAVVGGLAALSARGNEAAKPFAEAFRQRLSALAQAHEYVRPHSPDSARESAGETVHGLMRLLLEPYLHEGAERFAIEGDDAPIGPKSATSLALIMHEQATNAMKYGALSVPRGRVVLTGEREGGAYRLTWREMDGPRVEGPPERKGFGTALAARSVAGQLGGSLDHDWAPGGLVMRLCVPEENLSR
jgi:PAS domain S-box-containing protein